MTKIFSTKNKSIAFWSSVELKSVMQPIVDELNKLGFNASHHYFISSRSYRSATTPAQRLFLKIRMYILYPVYFIIIECCKRNRISVVSTNTFFVPLISAFVSFRSRNTIHLVYDLFPDILEVSKTVKFPKIILQLCDRIVDLTSKKVVANILLGTHLHRHFLRIHPNASKPSIIPVGTNTDTFFDKVNITNKEDDEIEILYCGNLGHLHELETLKKTFSDQTLKDLAVTFKFCGGGSGMSNLSKFLKGSPCQKVTLEGSLDSNSWSQAMNSSQVGLVTMKCGSENVLLPSKTYSAMAAGQAILAICPEDSDLANIVHTHNCGWVIKPGDATGLISTIKFIVLRKDNLKQKRENALAAALEFYGPRPIAQKWIEVLKSE